MIIGLCGAAGSGKDTVGAALREKLGYRKASFARPLKEALNLIFGWSLHSWDILEWKETPRPECYGLTPRECAQTFGTDWGRDTVDQNIWVDAAMRQLRSHGGNDEKFVFTDVRFPNEARAIRGAGGILVVVVCRDRATGTESSDHKSESWLPWLDLFADVKIEANFGQIKKLQEVGVNVVENYLAGNVQRFKTSVDLEDQLDLVGQEIERAIA